jgi:hydrogenase maturation protein HypF
MALAQLITLCGEEEVIKLPLTVVRRAGERNVRLIARLLEHKLNTPLTSSAGRLFDAVAALVDVPGTEQVTYEGQAAVELELALRGQTHHGYPFRLRPEKEGSVVETRGIIAGALEDLLAERTAGEISCRFHRTMVEVVAACCAQIREARGVNVVALSGGTFQNVHLLQHAVNSLESRGFVVYRHRRVPANDGGLCLGQAVLADWQFRKGMG